MAKRRLRRRRAVTQRSSPEACTSCSIFESIAAWFGDLGPQKHVCQAAFMACFETNILVIEGETCFAKTCVFQSKKNSLLGACCCSCFPFVQQKHSLAGKNNLQGQIHHAEKCKNLRAA